MYNCNLIISNFSAMEKEDQMLLLVNPAKVKESQKKWSCSDQACINTCNNHARIAEEKVKNAIPKMFAKIVKGNSKFHSKK